MGDVVENFTEGKNPKIDTLNGKTVRIEKINPDHFEDLFQVYGELSTEDSLTYISFRTQNRVSSRTCQLDFGRGHQRKKSRLLSCLFFYELLTVKDLYIY